MIKNPEIVLHEISIENANLKDFVVTLLSNNEKGYNSVQ